MLNRVNKYFYLINILLIIILSGCGEDSTQSPIPTGTPVIPTSTPTGYPLPTSTPTSYPVVKVELNPGKSSICNLFYIDTVIINFPEHSVTETTTITGMPSSYNCVLPEGMEKATYFYSFTMDEPNAYIINTADITMKKSYSQTIFTTGSAIMISNDGKKWDNIGGTINGNSITAKVPHFSYFFVGKPK